MLKKILLASMFVITAITNVAHAEDDMKTVASKAYVDTQIETKQLKIPAAGQPNVGAGETVMTYTATGNGEIGERGLYSDISSYNASTDGDKLITASALNATFTNLPTTPTTKLECANQADGCTLWTIVDQTAYHRVNNLFNKASIELNRIINASTGVATPNTGKYSSDYIIVKPNTTYSCNGFDDTSGVNGVAFYDSNKDFVSGINYSYSVVYDKRITVPNNSSIKYMRFGSYNRTSPDDCMLVEGPTLPTTYIPYYDSDAPEP